MEQRGLEVDFEVERLNALVWKTIASFFVGSYELAERVVLSDSLRLNEDLWLDDLGLEDLADFINERVGESVASARGLEGRTFGEAVATVAAQLEGKQVAFPAEKAALVTVWSLEQSGSLRADAEGLMDPGQGYGDDLKLFARLRRTHREVGRPFAFHWKALSGVEQRRLLFQAGLPATASDEHFGVALTLLPQVHVAALQGEGLVDLLEARLKGDYRDIVRADMEFSRQIAARFACPDAWQHKAMVLEGRKQVRLKTEKDEARLRDHLSTGQAVPGKVWAVYQARAASVQVFLTQLLEQFRKHHEALLKAKKLTSKHQICDVCGLFQDKLQVCGRCKSRYYCSRECQTTDWKEGHKAKCAKPAFVLRFSDNESESE